MDSDKFEIDDARPAGDGSHVVGQGECIYSLAARFGHDWKTIWNHPDNAGLKAARKDPGILLPGDRVHIPEVAPKSVDLASGRRHRVVIMGQNVELNLRMCDAEGEPVADAKYEIVVGKRRIPATTDGNGQLKASIPAAAAEVELRNLETGETYRLSLGHMDPADTASAVRKRLANLGYRLDAVDGGLDDQAVTAVSAFCEDANVSPDAPPDEVVGKLAKEDPWGS